MTGMKCVFCYAHVSTEQQSTKAKEAEQLNAVGRSRMQGPRAAGNHLDASITGLGNSVERPTDGAGGRRCEWMSGVKTPRRR
jgi:hypothetical protein